ncbi:MAG TPA: hypothetical protein VK658_10590 [Chryseolinea sp.]|nr:hypothetical protein [Chryseolinea sp.]
MGISLFLVSGIELLKIKDNYHPERMTTPLILLMICFAVSVIVSTFLILQGLRGNIKR